MSPRAQFALHLLCAVLACLSIVLALGLRTAIARADRADLRALERLTSCGVTREDLEHS